jgi:hypothetical protein
MVADVRRRAVSSALDRLMKFISILGQGLVSTEEAVPIG